MSRVVGGDYIRAAVKRAGLSGMTWHSLRHSHASTLLSAGVSPALVAERLGHGIQTLMRTYAQVTAPTTNESALLCYADSRGLSAAYPRPV